ncbi:MAG: DUF4350 domain-containing protein [Armatimonadetes bacterium]|nr:DUF4350 domain-containing protein [Armatimonadota bacterium]
MSQHTRVWSRIAIFLVFAVAYLFLMQALHRARDSSSLIPVPTSYNAGPFGAKAFYLLLKKAGYRVVRNTRPLGKIPAEVGTLVLLDPSNVFGAPVSEKEWSRISEWVASGHSLLLSVSYLQQVLGWEAISPEEMPPSLEPKSVLLRPLNATRFTQGVVAVRGLKDMHLASSENAMHGYLPVLSQGEKLRMAAWRKGRGWVVVMSDSSMLSNMLIAREDNALLALNTMQILTEPSKSRKVWFDEFHHGFSSVAMTLPRLIWRPPVRWIALQAVVALLLFLYSEGKRFGQPLLFTPGRERPRASRFVASMANVYRKAGARDAAYSLLRDSFRRDLINLMRLPAASALKDLLAAAEKRGVQPGELEPLLRSWTAGMDESTFLHYTRSLEEIRRRLSPGGRNVRSS